MTKRMNEIGQQKSSHASGGASPVTGSSSSMLHCPWSQACARFSAPLLPPRVSAPPKKATVLLHGPPCPGKVPWPGEAGRLCRSPSPWQTVAWLSALPSPGPGDRAQGQDLQRSFSSSVPLEVTDSAWMNSENSIRPSWQERGQSDPPGRPGSWAGSDGQPQAPDTVAKGCPSGGVGQRAKG